MEIRLKARITTKNERLVRARERLGLSIKDFADKIGSAYQSYLAIENLKISPSIKTVIKISKALNESPKYLFPDKSKEYVKELKKINKTKEMVVQAEKLISGVKDQQKELLLSDLRQDIETCLNKLDGRERKIVYSRFYENKTYEDIGYENDITRERARQIEAKALRKLRHPSVSRDIKGYLTDGTNL